MQYSGLLEWLTNDPTAMVTLVYWLAASLTVVIAIALVIVAMSGFRRALVQANAGPFRPGTAVDVRVGSGLFQASARDAFRASLAGAPSGIVRPAFSQDR